jgi:hypothetical protein
MGKNISAPTQTIREKESSVRKRVFMRQGYRFRLPNQPRVRGAREPAGGPEPYLGYPFSGRSRFGTNASLPTECAANFPLGWRIPHEAGKEIRFARYFSPGSGHWITLFCRPFRIGNMQHYEVLAFVHLSFMANPPGFA